MKIVLAVFLILFVNKAVAVSVTESFTSNAQLDSGDLIWNHVLNQVHPPLKVYQFKLNGGDTLADKTFSLGDARHGIFDSTTYDDFDEDGDSTNNIIVITTDNYPEGLQVTNFELDSGITLRPVGSLPLVIKSYSDVIVSGVIDCSGGDGEDLNADNSVVTTGGEARCAGAAGGRGGSTTLSPTDGSDAGGIAEGGKANGFDSANGGMGGGGGGAFSFNGLLAADGENPSGGAGGSAGVVDNLDAVYDTLKGGSGGAGGGATQATAALNFSSGGAGGAGGGVVLIYAARHIRVLAGGVIQANGGSGGSGSVNLYGGAGGGGGGGSILMFAGDELTNVSPSGILAIGGAAGATTNPNNSDGGAGVLGRFWGTDKSGEMLGSGTENPPVIYNVEGAVAYDTGTFSLETKSYELLNTTPAVTGFTLTSTVPGGSDFNLYVAHSLEEDFDASTSYVLSSLMVGESVSRFVKFKLEFVTPDNNNPVLLNSLAINYDKTYTTDFDMISACGSVNQNSGGNWVFLFLLPFSLLFLLKIRNTA